MRTDLQRVAVEYASSNWADDALLRLALLDYAGGQLDASARTLERIALDHSTSPLYPRAALWAGRVYFELRRPDDACRWLRRAASGPATTPELAAQLAARSSGAPCRGPNRYAVAPPAPVLRRPRATDPALRRLRPWPSTSAPTPR